MEMTREKVEAIAAFNYKDTCEKCRSGKEMLAAALLAEMGKPKVWDNAPEWATDAYIQWSAKTHYSGVFKSYTRELPKSRERQIADEVYGLLHTDVNKSSIDIPIIEKALLKYKAELEAGR